MREQRIALDRTVSQREAWAWGVGSLGSLGTTTTEPRRTEPCRAALRRAHLDNVRERRGEAEGEDQAEHAGMGVPE
jgi:hypothetical protein